MEEFPKNVEYRNAQRARGYAAKVFGKSSKQNTKNITYGESLFSTKDLKKPSGCSIVEVTTPNYRSNQMATAVSILKELADIKSNHTILGNR